MWKSCCNSGRVVVIVEELLAVTVLTVVEGVVVGLHSHPPHILTYMSVLNTQLVKSCRKCDDVIYSSHC